MSEAALWGIGGIIVTVLVATPTWFVVQRRKSYQQKQHVGNDAKAYQAGRDNNVSER